MTAGTHRELASFIWSMCNLLRGACKRNEYRKVILPLTVLRRFHCLLASTKERVLGEHYEIPLIRHFYVYEPPRPLEVIEAERKTLDGEIVALLRRSRRER
jgi:type I restriction-modification system DNA methylase subunit